MGGEEIVFVVLAGIVLTVAFAVANLELYGYLFGEEEPRRSKSITNERWFRGLAVPFIFFPGFNFVGLLILIYMRAMKALDIN
jgi:hypothetical protein